MTDQSIERKLYSEHVIDNRRVSMVDALKYLLKQEEFKTLDVAVGYFYISGLLLLKDEFADFMDRRNGHFLMELPLTSWMGLITVIMLN